MSDAAAELPNGLTVFGLPKSEAHMIHAQVQEYFDNPVVVVAEGMTVFDVGAHFGLFALEVLRRARGNINLHCFEPSPVAYEALVRNVRQHFPDSAVAMHPCALSNRRGESTFYIRPYATATSSLFKDAPLVPLDHIVKMIRDPNLPSGYKAGCPSWIKYLPHRLLSLLLRSSVQRMSKTEEVRCRLRTLSEVIREYNVRSIDLLKIDVEEAELDVLNGIESDDWSKVRRVALEVHDNEGRLVAIQTLLANQGFGRILTNQEYVFQGTNIYNVCADRNRE